MNRTPISIIQNPFANIIRESINSVFEDVVVRPTESQIANAVEDLQYTLDIDSQRCPISMDSFNEGDAISRIRHCGHVFGRSALRNWFSRSVRCPVCRYDIPADVQQRIDSWVYPH